MTAKTDDLNVILPTVETVTVGDVPVIVRRLRAKEFFALMRIVTTGIGPGLQDVSFSGDQEEQASQMLGLLVVALPNALDEFSEFLKLLLEPKNKSDQKRLMAELENPDPGDLLDVITIVAEQEKDDLQTLVGKATAAVTRIRGLYAPAG